MVGHGGHHFRLVGGDYFMTGVIIDVPIVGGPHDDLVPGLEFIHMGQGFAIPGPVARGREIAHGPRFLRGLVMAKPM